MNRKGQAAMEFLMTYGWAILAAIIAIGVLAYFGVFSPGKYVTDSTVVNPPFYANGQNAMQSSGNVSIELKDNGGEDYVVTNVAIKSSTSAVVCSNTGYNQSVTAGSAVVAKVPCTGLVAGNSLKGDITITYMKSGSTLPLTTTGTISSKIVA